MSSQKAREEIRELKAEQVRIQKEKDSIYFQQRKVPWDSYTRKGLDSELRKLDNKYYKIQDRLSEIENIGFSTKERTSLKREIASFSTLSHSSNIGSRDRKVIGYSKVLQNYVIVGYTSYSGFMRNVRGMGSLAGTKDINSVKVISKAQYDRIMAMERRPPRSRGWGTSRREAARPETLGGVF